ncbi:MAG: transcriptional repressor [Armatimonadetes bacterium]|nr:transcriptional repressor [Armatimonadota bacterium]
MKERTPSDPRLTGHNGVEEAIAYEERSLAELRKARYRITMPKVQVIRALADTETALSAYAIHDKVIRAGGKIDVVSVYRILTTLEELGLICRIGVVNGYFPSRLSGSTRHRSEMVVCERCGHVTQLEAPEMVISALEKQAAEAGLTPNTIRIEMVSTTCPQCKGK